MLWSVKGVLPLTHVVEENEGVLYTSRLKVSNEEAGATGFGEHRFLCPKLGDFGGFPALKRRLTTEHLNHLTECPPGGAVGFRRPDGSLWVVKEANM